MVVTKVDILTELTKPLDTPKGVLSASLLSARLGVSKEHIRDEWLAFHKELAYCIKAGLIEFYFENDNKEFKEHFQTYIDVNFYLNYLAEKLILITPTGELWLNQHIMSKEIHGVKTSVDSNNKSIEKLDKRSLAIGLTLIALTAIGILVAFLHL